MQVKSPNAFCYISARMISPPARMALIVLLLLAVGCFTQPTAQEPAESKTTTVIPLPFDLTWTAVNNVIQQNDFQIQAQDPNHGILEVLGHRFSLQDADCGKIKSIGGTYAVEPEADGTAVYNFQVKPVSNESTRVTVRASYDSPLHVPFHTNSDVQCTSRGAEESRLLQQILAQARVTHPPAYRKPGAPEPAPSAPFLAPGRPTLLKPGMLPKGLSE